MKPLQRVLGGLVRRMLRRDLRAAFRRVAWVGAAPRLPRGVPVICFANHHSYYDGHLLWLVVEEMLGRPATLWMADWDRFPFFGAAGAQPFPEGDARRRSATLRRTARRFREDPETVLIYFPEGRLRAPEEGIAPFSEKTFERLDRLFPEKVWWPVAIHVTWWGEAKPTALLSGGAPHAEATGRERACLAAQWNALCSQRPHAYLTLLEGRPGVAERWDFSLASRFFRRYL